MEKISSIINARFFEQFWFASNNIEMQYHVYNDGRKCFWTGAFELQTSEFEPSVQVFHETPS